MNIADLSACFVHCEEERSSDDRSHLTIRVHVDHRFIGVKQPFAARFCLATPDIAGTCTVLANRLSLS